MSPVENFTQSAKRYGLHKQITHESVHGKTYDKMYEETDQSANWSCTSVVWSEPSLMVCASYNLWV